MGNSASAQHVYQVFKDHLDKNKFKYNAFDDDLVISLTVHGEDLPQPTLIRVMEANQVVQVLSPIPSRIPEDKRIDGAVAVAVANSRLINGCFDYDMSTGEIRFRVAQSFAGIDFGDPLAHYILGVTFLTTDDYNDKFFALGKGLMSLEQFLEKEGK